MKVELKGKSKIIFASSPLVVAIMTGLLSLIGAEVANILQTRANFELEREKEKSSLILKAIETGNPEAATRNLLFLLRTGLISDPSGKIAALEARPQDGPVLPVSGNGVVPHGSSAREGFFVAYATPVRIALLK